MFGRQPSKNLVEILRFITDRMRYYCSYWCHFLLLKKKKRTAQTWFAKFGNFDIEDAPRFGKLVEADKDGIKALIDANQRITTRKIVRRLNLLNSTIHDQLKCLDFTSKLDKWAPNGKKCAIALMIIIVICFSNVKKWSKQSNTFRSHLVTRKQ